MAESRFTAASDGLRLHALDDGDPRSPRLPVVCLPGLSRTAEDFTPLATALAKDRRVLALDLRGRGRSGYDRDPANYKIAVETDDVIAVMTALAVGPAVFVGTSRGGLVTMTLATKRADLLAGVVLNDIGPVVDTAGVMRIKSYVGKLRPPASFEQGADILRDISDDQFPNLTAAEWLAAAKRAWREDGGRLVVTYDPALTHTLETVSPDKPFPTLWQEFDAMAGGAAHGRAWRQFRHPQRRDGDRHAGAPARHGGRHGPRSGPCPAAVRRPHHRRHRGVRSEVRCGARQTEAMTGGAALNSASFRGARSANPESRQREQQATAHAAKPPGFRVPPRAAPE